MLDFKLYLSWLELFFVLTALLRLISYHQFITKEESDEVGITSLFQLCSGLFLGYFSHMLIKMLLL